VKPLPRHLTHAELLADLLTVQARLDRAAGPDDQEFWARRREALKGEVLRRLEGGEKP
jgi:hypothetical protein